MKMTINHTRNNVHIDRLGAFPSFLYHFLHCQLQPHYLARSYPSFHKQRIYIYPILNRLEGVQCHPQTS